VRHSPNEVQKGIRRFRTLRQQINGGVQEGSKRKDLVPLEDRKGGPRGLQESVAESTQFTRWEKKGVTRYARARISGGRKSQKRP